MLHEAVIFEIYKQALSAREIPTMRCPSRQSTISGVLEDSRCTSNHSQYSGVENSSPIQTPIPFAFSNDFDQEKSFLPVTSLFPSQSTAMAVYFNAAAVAAVQQSHLLLTHPLVTTPPLIQQTRHSLKTSLDVKSQKSKEIGTVLDADCTRSILNFATDYLRPESNNSISVDKSVENSEKCIFGLDEFKETSNESVNSPLDLSLSKDRKREISSEKLNSPDRKMLRMNTIKSTKFDLWVPTISKYLASVNAANYSEQSSESIHKIALTDKNVKEKSGSKESVFDKTLSTAESIAPSTPDEINTVYNSNVRHNAWQSHWLNKGVDVVKDILKCVWCKESFPSLDSLTKHLKGTQHCGISNMGTSVSSNSDENQYSQNSANSSLNIPISNMFSKYQISSTSEKKSDTNLQIKESLPLPRKLVRGQDVWIGKGAEQTRQILKCMWCGQSFRSLAEMTSHMQETQHYTNIVSQEQIISWKSNDEKKMTSNNSQNVKSDIAVSAMLPKSQPIIKSETNPAVKNITLICEFCNQAFPTLKELNHHKIQSNHNLTDGNQIPKKRCRQAREKRKRSLPVRKLLEIERAEYNGKSNGSSNQSLTPIIDFTDARKISCEKCENKIDTVHFVEHIRQCLGETTFNTSNKDSSKSHDVHSIDENYTKIVGDLKLTNNEKHNSISTSTSSVLSAIEELIEKSFDKRSPKKSGHSFTPLKSSILKRLRIDNNDIQQFQPMEECERMNYWQTRISSKRNRSESESSSISDRCGSQMDTKRSIEISNKTPKLEDLSTGDTAKTTKVSPERNNKIHRQSEYNNNNNNNNEVPIKMSTKEKNKNSEVNHNILDSKDKVPTVANSLIRAISPTFLQKSVPSLTSNSIQIKKSIIPENCLNALTSMFDNLNNKHSNNMSSTNSINKKCIPYNNSKFSTNASPLVALQKLCEVNETVKARSLNRVECSNNHDQLNGEGGDLVFNWPYSDFEISPEPEALKKTTMNEVNSGLKGIQKYVDPELYVIKDDTDSQSSNSFKSQAPQNSPISMVLLKTTSRELTKEATVHCTNNITNITQQYDNTQSKFLKYTELAKQLSSKNC